jgi:D-sedoheptulose 7-phosphate isomerase
MFDDDFQHFLQTLENTRLTAHTSIGAIYSEWYECITQGGKLLLFGNGGSALLAQHVACELVVRFSMNRAPIPAISLTSDGGILTAICNDFSFEELFARQIVAFAQPPDVAVGITTSGKSKNVLAGLRKAKSIGIRTCAFVGNDSSMVAEFADTILKIPSDTTATIQEMHLFCSHILCRELEKSCLP